MFEDTIVLFCRVVLIVVFIHSAIGKILSMSKWRSTIEDFGLSSPRISGWISIAVVVVEMLSAGLLVVGRSVLLSGFILSAALLVAFTGILIHVIKSSTLISCNCFGQSDRPTTFWDVVRNLTLILLCVIGLVLVPRETSTLDSYVVVLITLVAVQAATVLTNLHDIAATLLRPFRTS